MQNKPNEILVKGFALISWGKTNFGVEAKADKATPEAKEISVKNFFTNNIFPTSKRLLKFVLVYFFASDNWTDILLNAPDSTLFDWGSFDWKFPVLILSLVS